MAPELAGLRTVGKVADAHVDAFADRADINVPSVVVLIDDVGGDLAQGSTAQGREGSRALSSGRRGRGYAKQGSAKAQEPDNSVKDPCCCFGEG